MRNFEIKQQKVMPVDRIKSLNSNVNNTQSMTNEEARQLTGKVAMTRALFESKENINSNINNSNQQPQMNRFSMQPMMNRTRQNSSNYNLSDYNAKFQQQQQQQQQIPKHSNSATNLSTILKQPNEQPHLVSSNNKENKYMPKYLLSNKQQIEQQQQQQAASYLTSILIKPTTDSEIINNNNKLLSNNQINDDSLVDYKFQNLNNSTFKPIIRKLKKFNNDEKPQETTTQQQQQQQQQYFKNPQPVIPSSDIVLPATSVKQVKASFENLAASFGGKVNSSNNNINRFKQSTSSLISKPAENNSHLTNNHEDNGSVSSVSSFSSTSNLATSQQQHQQPQSNPNLLNSKFEALKIAAGSSLCSSTSSASSSSASPIVCVQEVPQSTMKFDLPRSYIKSIPTPTTTTTTNTVYSQNTSSSSSCETTPRSNLEIIDKKNLKVADVKQNVNNIRNGLPPYKTESSAFYDRYRYSTGNSNQQTSESAKSIQKPVAIVEPPTKVSPQQQQQSYIQSPRFNNLQKQIETIPVNSTDRRTLTSVDENNEDKVTFRDKAQSVNVDYPYRTQKSTSLIPTSVWPETKKTTNDSSLNKNRYRSQSLIDQRQVQLSKGESSIAPAPIKK